MNPPLEGREAEICVQCAKVCNIDFTREIKPMRKTIIQESLMKLWQHIQDCSTWNNIELST